MRENLTPEKRQIFAQAYRSSSYFKKTQSNQHVGQCPICLDGGDDRFWISLKTGQFGCHICQESTKLAKALYDMSVDAGLIEPPQKKRERTKKSGQVKVVRKHDYHDQSGRVLVRHVKKSNGEFPWEYVDTQGNWEWGLGGVKMKELLYGREQINPEVHTVVMVEGEKDADTLRRLVPKKGIAYVSGPGGASNPSLKWSLLEDIKKLYIFFDADTAGRQGVQKYGNRALQEIPGVEVEVYAGKGDGAIDVTDIADLHSSQDEKRKAVVDWLKEHTKRAKPPLPPKVKQAESDIIYLGKVEFPKGKDSLKNALAVLGIEWGFDVRKDRPQVRELKRGSKWEELSDRRQSWYFDQIARRLRIETSRGNSPLVFGRDSRADAMNALFYEQEFDNFEVWLESMPDWPKSDEAAVEFLSSWMWYIYDHEGGSRVTPLAQWISRYIPLGVVYRTYQPGYKLDTIPILIGDQGLGKSTMLSLLLGSDPHEWFTDNLTFKMTSKERTEQMMGRVIVEIAEMVGYRKAEIDDWKRFASSRADSDRLSYRRDGIPIPRRCILVATTNEYDPVPNDPTGARRFPVIELKPHPSAGEDGIREKGNVNWLRKMFEDTVSDNEMTFRQAIWSAALHAYRKNLIRPELVGDLEKLSIEISLEKMHSDPVFDDAINDMVERGVTDKTLKQMVSEYTQLGTEAIVLGG